MKGPFRWAMIFSTSIDPLKSLLTVSRKFIFFHPNDTVHFRSFQSFSRITYTSHNFAVEVNTSSKAAPWGQTVRSWAVDLAEFLSNRGTTGEFKLLPSDAPQHQNVCAQSFMFCIFYGEYRCGRQDHGRIQRLWICKNNTPPNGLSSLRLLWLHFQSFLRKLTPIEVDLCNKCTTEWAFSTSIVVGLTRL